MPHQSSIQEKANSENKEKEVLLSKIINHFVEASPIPGFLKGKTQSIAEKIAQTILSEALEEGTEIANELVDSNTKGKFAEVLHQIIEDVADAAADLIGIERPEYYLDIDVIDQYPVEINLSEAGRYNISDLMGDDWSSTDSPLLNDACPC